MNSPASSITDDEVEQGPSCLWDLAQNEGPSFQEQLDASHQKCRTDWRISETIIVAQFKSLRREIAELREEDGEDEEMGESSNARQSESPLWDFAQGQGPSPQEQIQASHEKCRADWKVNESIIASELHALRLEIAQLKEREAEQEERLERLEESRHDHSRTLRFLMSFKESLRKKLNTMCKSTLSELESKVGDDLQLLISRGSISRFYNGRFWDFDKTMHDLEPKGISGAQDAPAQQ